jgi:hypothetical protein
MERMATTYSRGTYRTTTIGNAVFDGRVRDGIGSGHSFMVTKKLSVVSGEWSVAFLPLPLIDCHKIVKERVFVDYYTQARKRGDLIQPALF